MLLLSSACLLIILIHEGKCNNDSSACPTWTYRSPHDNQCVCGARVHSIICDPKTLTTVITVDYFCVFFSRELQSTLVGTCPYGLQGILPRNASMIGVLEDRDRFCFHLHRTGQFCGECEESYTLPVYSYFLGCVKCESYKNGWVKFAAAAFLPLTLFYIIVITFRISATSPTLNAFIMFNQIVAIPSILRELYTSSLDHTTGSYNYVYAFDFIIAVIAIWNLDFFRSFYGPICLHPDLKYQQVLLLEYAIGLYPLLLIIFTYLLIKLHDNFAIVVWLWKPVHRCLAVFRRQWNIQSYIVNALATFIVLSYVKILNTSFEFLLPSHVYNNKGHIVNKAYWYYNGSVDMTSKDYLPYLIVATFMLLTFNVLPLILLAIYPFRCVQRLLDNCLPVRYKVALQIYMDAFQGCYEDTAHDYRYFAALYVAVRFLNLLAVTMFSIKLYTPVASIIFTFMLALVAKFQPYKCKKNNTADIVILLAMITMYTSASMRYMEFWLFPNWLSAIILGTAALTIYGYLLFLVLSKHNIFLKIAQCLKKSKTFLNFLRYGKIEHGEVNIEDQALLNPDEADYNACDNR